MKEIEPKEGKYYWVTNINGEIEKAQCLFVATNFAYFATADDPRWSVWKDEIIAEVKPWYARIIEWVRHEKRN